MDSLTMSDSRFQYRPIDLATDAIRLVRLMKGSGYDPIVCELFETFLHQVDGTPYEALSYTWGTSEELIEINLCGKKTKIRGNLFTALWYLRRPDEDRLLWIDAICIDQGSHLEKGHQVRQMGSIYENAQNVHVWLGEATDDIDMLMHHMKQLDTRALRRLDYRRNSATAWETEWPILRDDIEKLGTIHSNFHARRCSAARELLSRPWFRRVWVIQEVFNAKVATVGCGWNTLPTRTFVLIPKLLGLDDTIDEHVQAVLEIMPGYLRQRSWHSQRPTLRTLIRKFVSSEATDPRDRVYALIGISSDAGSDGKLQPDYNKGVTMEAVIHRTLSYMLSVGDYGIYTDDSPLWDLHTLAGNRVQDLPKVVLRWALSSDNEYETAIRILKLPEFNPNSLDKLGQPPLLIMAGWPYLPFCWREVVGIILENPLVDVNITVPSSTDSPLNRAVAAQNIEMVRMLVQHVDIDINHIDGGGRTPIWVAAESDMGENMVPVLLGHPKVDINYCGCAALREALRKRNFSTAAILLQDSRINISSSRVCYGAGWMTELLVTTAEFGCHEVLNRALDLIEQFEGSLVEHALSSALLREASNNHTMSVILLLERINTEPERLSILGCKCLSDRKQTALHAAVDSPHMVMGLVRLLLSAGVPVDKADPEGRTALWIASDSGKEDLVEYLLKHGADANSKNDLGQSVLWIAAYRGRTRTVRLLVEGGADIREKDQQRRWAPLFAAGFERHEEVVRYLIKSGADPHEVLELLTEVSDPGELVRDTIEYIAQVAVTTRSSTSALKTTYTNNTAEGNHRVRGYSKEA